MREFPIPNRDVRGECRWEGFFPRRRADMGAELTKDVPGQIHLDLAGFGRALAAARLRQDRVPAERKGHHMFVAQPLWPAIGTAVDAPADRCISPPLNVFPTTLH